MRKRDAAYARRRLGICANETLHECVHASATRMRVAPTGHGDSRAQTVISWLQHADRMADISTSMATQDLTALMAAVRRQRGGEARRLTAAAWHALAGVLMRRTAEPHACLIREGECERDVFFVESGLLRVFRWEASERLLLGVVGAGSLVGEGAFFTPLARTASVEAIESTVVWELPRPAFERMAREHPQHALAVALYLGSVLSARMLSPAGRLSVT